MLRAQVMKQGRNSLLFFNGPILVLIRSFFTGGYLRDYEVKEVEMEDEFKVCPSCGYEDAFHSMFRKEGGVTKWLFICPACHDIFDIGFTV